MIPTPPRLLQRLLSWILPRAERSEVVGDLAEQFAAKRQTGSRATALVWYVRQCVSVPLWLWGARFRHLDADLLELRPALRRLLRSPGFTLVAVASLGLGIGANTAIFSVLRALVYAPLAVPAPEQLRFPFHTRPEGFEGSNINSSQIADPGSGVALYSNVHYPAYAALREAGGTSYSLAAFTFIRNLAVVDGDRPAFAATGALVSGNYFATLGLPAALGRTLQDQDGQPGAPLVVVLSHPFWLSAFGGDPAVVGRVIQVSGHPVEVVGVSREGFEGLSRGGFVPATEMTFPLSAQPLLMPRWTPEGGSLFSSGEIFWLRLLARTPDTETQVAAAREMGVTLTRSLRATGMLGPAEQDEVTVRLLPAERGLDTVRGATERPLKILAGVVAIVLMIACANVATLLLARGAARDREMAVRCAMGASRLRMAWPLFLEGALLAAVGGVAGILLAWWGGPAVAAALTAGMGLMQLSLSPDGTVLTVAATAAGCAALWTGILPALRFSRVDAGRRLGTRGPDAHRLRVGHALIVSQIAVSMPLVVGGGLLLRTVASLQSVDPGFRSADLTIFHVDPSSVTADAAESGAILERVLANVAELPFVTNATLMENVFLSGWISNTRVEIDGEDAPMHMNAVGPGFFETLGIPLVEGRTPDARDDALAPRVAVVNATAARSLFGGRAVGRTFRWNGREVEIIGVVEDVRYSGLREETPPTFFDPIIQRGATSAHVAVRSPSSGPDLDDGLAAAVARAHPGLPITDLRTQEAQLRQSMSRERVFARVLSLFGGFALLLASIGLHGLTGFAVSRRKNEMGVRLALGARPEEVLGLVIRQVATLALVGVALGLVASWATAPVVAGLLYDVAPTDPLTFGVAAAALFAVALAAGWTPARRAAGTDPLEALATE